MQHQAGRQWIVFYLCKKNVFRSFIAAITNCLLLIAIFIPESLKAQNRTSTPAENQWPARITENLLALYSFFDGGNTVHDISNVSAPLNLDISDPSKVEWLSNGGLHFRSDSGIAISNGPATKLFDNIVATNELTIEAWFETNNLTLQQTRIASYSISPSLSNATLNQHEDGIVVRIRTPESGLNGGHPEYDPPNTLDVGLHHVVATFNGERIRSYIDGIRITRSLKLSGGLTNWDPSFPFMIGNEATLNRQWLGKLYLIAVYNRALKLTEIQANFQAGLPDKSDTYPSQSTLIVRVEGSGSVVLDPPRGVYLDGTVVTLNALPDSGWVFSSWSGDLAGNVNPETNTLDSDKAVTATFIELPKYTLTASITGSGTVALDPPDGVYYDGTLVTLTATPTDTGWVFKGWSGDLSGNASPETITIDADKAVMATFTEQEIVSVEVDEIPEMYSLAQNYPNPFNPSTIIKFSIPKHAKVIIKVYSLNGQEVAELVDRFFPAGTHQITFRPKNLSSGVYVYELRADKVKQARRLIYVK